jgi:hypothetical protein
MGIKIGTGAQYAESLKRLFPQGSYWDTQFNDSASDTSLFIQAKLDELIRFRNRMADLLNESRVPTAVETISDWERVLKNKVNYGLSVAERRAILLAQGDTSVNRVKIAAAASLYGLTLIDIAFPFRPGLFGFSRFGQDRICSPAAFAVLFITCEVAADNDKDSFESDIRSRLPANIIYFFYGGA